MNMSININIDSFLMVNPNLLMETLKLNFYENGFLDKFLGKHYDIEITFMDYQGSKDYFNIVFMSSNSYLPLLYKKKYDNHCIILINDQKSDIDVFSLFKRPDSGYKYTISDLVEFHGDLKNIIIGYLESSGILPVRTIKSARKI